MKTKISFIAIIIALLSLQSCKTTKIEAPVESYQAVEYVPKVSTMNVPIELDLNLIRKMLNDNLKGLLYEDNNLEDDNLMLKAWKIRDFDLKYDKNAFVYSVPLKLWIKTGFNINKLGIAFSEYKEFEAQIVLNFRTSISLNKNWEVVSNTTIDSYQWISKPIMKVGAFEIPITTIANSLINANKTTLNKEIDLALRKNIVLRDYVQQLWEKVQNPIKVSDEYKTWLKISPVEISGTPIRGSNDKITMDVGLKSTVETFVGKEPSVKINKALPVYRIVDATNQSFEINLLSQIEYGTADSLAKKTLIGQTFSEGKYKVTILDLNIYGQGPRLVVAIKLKGSFNGTVYFTAIPYYEKETQSIKMKDFDFDYKTHNVLFGSFKWLCKGAFKGLIESKMVFPMSKYLAEIKTTLQPSLSNIQLHKNVTAKCTLNDIHIDDIFLINDGMKIAVSINGKLKIIVQ
jgi:hypothetical protein